MSARSVLLNPGPVTLTERVRSAFVREDICHREPEFAELLTDVRRRLGNVYPEAQGGFEAVVVSGSGTCAVEAMLSSFAPGGGKTIVVSNGVYGERMAAMLEKAGKSPVLVRSEWLEEINVAEVERALLADATISHVVAVHNETTSGRLNDLAPLGALEQEELKWRLKELEALIKNLRGILNSEARKLEVMLEELDEIIEEAKKKNLTPTDAFDRLCDAEVQGRTQRAIARRISKPSGPSRIIVGYAVTPKRLTRSRCSSPSTFTATTWEALAASTTARAV